MTNHAQNHSALSMADEIESYRYTFLKKRLELLNRHKKLQVEEEEARRRRDAQFPISVDAYRAIQNRTIQVECLFQLLLLSHVNENIFVVEHTDPYRAFPGGTKSSCERADAVRVWLGLETNRSPERRIREKRAFIRLSASSYLMLSLLTKNF